LQFYDRQLQISDSKISIKSQGSKKTRVFLKSPTQWVFWGIIGFFLDKQEKIGKQYKNSVT